MKTSREDAFAVSASAATGTRRVCPGAEAPSEACGGGVCTVPGKEEAGWGCPLVRTRAPLGGSRTSGAYTAGYWREPVLEPRCTPGLRCEESPTHGPKLVTVGSDAAVTHEAYGVGRSALTGQRDAAHSEVTSWVGSSNPDDGPEGLGVVMMHRSRVHPFSRMTRAAASAVLAITVVCVGGAATASALQVGPTPVSCNGTMTPSGVCLIPPLTVTDTLPTVGTAARAITATPSYVG